MKNKKISKDDLEAILISYSHPLLDGGREHIRSCGLCKKNVIMAREAKIELAKKEPNLKDFYDRVEISWKRTKHVRLFKKLQASGIKDIKEIEKEFQKRGLEL